jgi:hypothetical protein
MHSQQFSALMETWWKIFKKKAKHPITVGACCLADFIFLSCNYEKVACHFVPLLRDGKRKTKSLYNTACLTPDLRLATFVTIGRQLCQVTEPFNSVNVHLRDNWTLCCVAESLIANIAFSPNALLPLKTQIKFATFKFHRALFNFYLNFIWFVQT